MSRVTQELLANNRAREAEGMPELLGGVLHSTVPTGAPVIKKPAAKKRTKAKAKKRA